MCSINDDNNEGVEECIWFTDLYIFWIMNTWELIRFLFDQVFLMSKAATFVGEIFM